MTTAPCPKCGHPSVLAAIHGPCLTCTMGWKHDTAHKALRDDFALLVLDHTHDERNAPFTTPANAVTLANQLVHLVVLHGHLPEIQGAPE